MRIYKLPQRLLAIVMSVILILGLAPITAAANTVEVNTDEGIAYEEITDEGSSNDEIVAEEVSAEEISNEEILNESSTEMKSLQRTTTMAGTIYTVSSFESSETNIAWTDLATKLEDGTIKSGDVLQITETTSQVNRLTIPAGINELTIAGNGYMEQALAIITNAPNMKLKLKDITLSAFFEPSIMFGGVSELVTEGYVVLKSNSRVIFAQGDLTISGSGNLDVNGIERTNVGMEALVCKNLIINHTGTLKFNGGSGVDDGGFGIFCERDLTLNSGNVFVQGGDGGKSNGNGNGGVGIQCYNLTVNGNASLSAKGGNSTNRHGGIGIYSSNNLTIENGGVNATGGNGGIGGASASGDGGTGIYCSNFTINNSSGLETTGGNCPNGIAGNGIYTDYFTFNSDFGILAKGGDNSKYFTESSKAIQSNTSINMSGTGSIQFKDGTGTVTTTHAVTFSTASQGLWNVNPAERVMSGNPSALSITVQSTYNELTTVSFAGQSKPILTIDSQPRDTIVTVDSIDKNLVVVASASGNVTLTYQWFSSMNGSNNGSALYGATSSLFSIPTNLSIGNYYYYCEISAPGADSIKTQVVKVTVTPPAIVAVSDITGVPTTATAGTPVTLTGTVVPANATNIDIIWGIKDRGTTGAVCDDNILSTTSAGTVVVTATIIDGISIEIPYTQDFTITVSEAPPTLVSVTDITGIPTTATAGTDVTLTGTVAPENATNKTITWSIFHAGTTGATLNGNILSTATAGTVLVTATITDGIIIEGTSILMPYSKNFAITVSAAPTAIVAVTNITGVPTTATVGTDLTLTGTVVPSNATNKIVTWSIFNAGTTGATLNGNILTTTAVGTVIVTATIIDGTSIENPYKKNFTVTVNELPPAIVAVTNITGVLTTATAGIDVTLTGTVVPTNATNKIITWSINTPGATGATLSGNVLSTTAAGTVILTATIIDGTSIEIPYTKDFTVIVSAASNGGSGNNPDNGSNPGNGSNPDNGGNTGNNGSNPDDNNGNPDDNNSNPDDNEGDPNNSGTTPSTGTQQITVDVKQGNSNSVASQITIERTTNENGEKSDKVTYEKEKATETVQKLKAEGKDTARIVIPDARDEVSETNIYIPTTSLGTLSKGNINLQIDTEEAKINLSKESMKSISRSMTDDLYFRLVPVKNETEKEAVSSQAKMNAVLISNNKNVTATVIGNPVTIETNMPSAETIITLPLTGISIPTKATDREALLKQLAVYIEHSDGDKELVQGELVEYKKGQYGISFSINKFSTFTVVKTDAFLKSTEKAITKITAPANAVIKGSNITATVANEISSITVKVKVSDKAAWKLYLDKDLKKEAVNGKLKLTTGVNTSYIKVTAQDKSTKLYKLTITRNKSSLTEITKVILNENTVIKGSTITATVANEKTSLTVKAQVSNNASYKIYSDKSLKKEISNHKLNLKVGINTIYLKVTAENGKSTKAYTLKITRKEQEYKSKINLGLIGSEKYANIVARIFKQEYDTANVKVTSKGKYYLVTMSFKDRAAAKKACKDMIRRQYIVNYYFN